MGFCYFHARLHSTHAAAACPHGETTPARRIPWQRQQLQPVMHSARPATRWPHRHPRRPRPGPLAAQYTITFRVAVLSGWERAFDEMPELKTVPRRTSVRRTKGMSANSPSCTASAWRPRCACSPPSTPKLQHRGSQQRGASPRGPK